MKVYIAHDREFDVEAAATVEAWLRPDHETVKEEGGDLWHQQEFAAQVTAAIGRADVVVVLMGKRGNSVEEGMDPPGVKNWVDFMVVRARELGKPIVAVKLPTYAGFSEGLMFAGAKLVEKFDRDSISKAL